MRLHIRQRAVSARKHLSVGCLASQWDPRGQIHGVSAHRVSSSLPAWCGLLAHGEVWLRRYRKGSIKTRVSTSAEVFSGRATTEKPRKVYISANKFHIKVTAVRTSSQAPLCLEAPKISGDMVSHRWAVQPLRYCK